MFKFQLEVIPGFTRKSKIGLLTVERIIEKRMRLPSLKKKQNLIWLNLASAPRNVNVQ